LAEDRVRGGHLPAPAVACDDVAMDESLVRTHAESFCEALVAGDVDRAISDFSDELRRNLGEVLTLFPLPATAGRVDSVALSGAGYNVVMTLTGESEEVQVQTRWKDRDGEPKVVEASHLSRTVMEAEATEEEGAAESDEGSA
jgi:hypothetical protein